MRDIAGEKFSAEKQRLEAAADANTASGTKAAKQQPGILHSYLQHAPALPLPHYPTLLQGYQPDKQRLLVLTDQHKALHSKQLIITNSDGVQLSINSLQSKQPDLQPIPALLTDPAPATASGLQYSLLQDIHSISSPLYITDVGLLARRVDFPPGSGMEHTDSETPIDEAKLQLRTTWIVQALAEGRVQGIHASTVKAIMWRQLRQAFLDKERLEQVHPAGTTV